MNKEELFDKIDDCFQYADMNGIENAMQSYASAHSDEQTSTDIAEYIYKRFTTHRADAMAALLQLTIRTNANLALLNYPKNYLFKLTVLRGSVDLYSCYIEEAIKPFLTNKSEDEQMEYYADLYGVAYNLNDDFFDKYIPCVKGMDFNGIFSHSDNPELSLIHTTDFEVMDDVVEKYNTIIGRRDILKDLEDK
jgi:hypothetical protein